MVLKDVTSSMYSVDVATHWCCVFLQVCVAAVCRSLKCCAGSISPGSDLFQKHQKVYAGISVTEMWSELLRSCMSVDTSVCLSSHEIVMPVIFILIYLYRAFNYRHCLKAASSEFRVPVKLFVCRLHIVPYRWCNSYFPDQWCSIHFQWNSHQKGLFLFNSVNTSLFILQNTYCSYEFILKLQNLNGMD